MYSFVLFGLKRQSAHGIQGVVYGVGNTVLEIHSPVP